MLSGLREIKDALAWSAMQFVLYLFASLSILFAGSFSTILNVLVETEQEKTQLRSIGGVVQTSFGSFLGGLEGTDNSATITTLLFWAAAGAALYLLFWIGISAFNDFQNNTAISNVFVHSQSFNKDSHWSQYFQQTAFRFLILILLIAYFIFFVRLWVPLWVQLFQIAVADIQSVKGVGSLALSIVGCIISLHVFSVLFRFFLLRRRVLS